MTESYDVKLGEEGGLPKPLENPGGKSATAALGWRETDLVEPTGTQTQLQLAKNLPLHYRMYASPTKPKAREDTSPLRPPWLGGHPSVGGGTALQGHLTGDGMLWFVCV